MSRRWLLKIAKKNGLILIFFKLLNKEMTATRRINTMRMLLSERQKLK